MTVDGMFTYTVNEVHLRALNSDGSVHVDGLWVKSTGPVSFGMDPVIEAGKKTTLKAGGTIKNNMQSKDQLTGATIKLEMDGMCPEFEYVLAGSAGTIEYDDASPTLAIGYLPPTADEQVDALDYEMRVYREKVDGSNVVAYYERSFFQCKPAFISESGGQEEHPKIEAKIDTVENANYDEDGRPAYGYTLVTAIP
jgi:hypothetical protein